jgi:hypothetical protein
MTPEEIVSKIEQDMVEGAQQYQPAYWKAKATERIRAAIANSNANAAAPAAPVRPKAEEPGKAP